MESKLLEQTQYCSLADVAGKFFFSGNMSNRNHMFDTIIIGLGNLCG